MLSKNCDFCNFCDSSKNCEKLEKSQFLLRLIKSSGTGGRRVSSKNCDFCNFCDFSKKCEKLEKSLFLLKLIKSSVTGGRRVSSKNCDFCNFYDFSKNCKKMGEIAVFAKINFLISQLEVEGCPTKTAISPRIAKNWRNCSFCYKLQFLLQFSGFLKKIVKHKE